MLLRPFLLLILSLNISMGDLLRCPEEEIQVIASATALDGEYIQGVIYWPVVTGTGDSLAIGLMNRAMDYELVTGESLEWTLENFSEYERGVVSSMFTVNTLQAGILDVTISVEFLGAYPSTFRSYFTFDTGTGVRLSAADILLEEGIDDLVALLDDDLQRNIEAKMRENEEYYGDVTYVQEYDQHFAREDLEQFTVLPEGVIFRHDFCFAHVALALEPEEEIFLEWDVVGEFVDMEGPLGALAAGEN
jgi:hypothetical protein